jgi:hypothetical protein
MSYIENKKKKAQPRLCLPHPSKMGWILVVIGLAKGTVSHAFLVVDASTK